MCHFIRKYPLSLLICVAIWILCFIDIPETPLDNVSLIDKWTHIVMYLGLCLVLWWEYLRAHAYIYNKVWAAIGGCLLPMLMGGVIEILQAYCTGGRRSGDWIDFLADAVGVLLAQLICIPLARRLAKRRKGR